MELCCVVKATARTTNSNVLFQKRFNCHFSIRFAFRIDPMSVCAFISCRMYRVTQLFHFHFDYCPRFYSDAKLTFQLCEQIDSLIQMRIYAYLASELSHPKHSSLSQHNFKLLIFFLPHFFCHFLWLNFFFRVQFEQYATKPPMLYLLTTSRKIHWKWMYLEAAIAQQ